MNESCMLCAQDIFLICKLKLIDLCNSSEIEVVSNCYKFVICHVRMLKMIV